MAKILTVGDAAKKFNLSLMGAAIWLGCSYPRAISAPLKEPASDWTDTEAIDRPAAKYGADPLPAGRGG